MAAPTKEPTLDKSATKRWMAQHAAEHIDPKTGECNSTALAEAAARHFNVDEIGGPLEDETHWIWDAALSASTSAERVGPGVRAIRAALGRRVA